MSKNLVDFLDEAVENRLFGVTPQVYRAQLRACAARIRELEASRDPRPATQAMLKHVEVLGDTDPGSEVFRAVAMNIQDDAAGIPRRMARHRSRPRLRRSKRCQRRWMSYRIYMNGFAKLDPR